MGEKYLELAHQKMLESKSFDIGQMSILLSFRFRSENGRGLEKYFGKI